MSAQNSGRDALARVAALGEWGVAGLATSAALALSLWCARNAGAFFRDEVNSLNVAASPSLAELWRMLEFESSPALWLLLLRGWLSAFGAEGDAVPRVFALLCGFTLPAALWFAARRLGGTVPLVGLALLAVNPVVIRWASSLRAWGVGAALAVVALVCVWEATREPTRRRVAAAALFAVLSVHCVYQNAVLLAAAIAGAMAVAVAEGRWRRAAVPFGIGVLAALSLFVYLPTLERISAWNMLNRSSVSLGQLARRAVSCLESSGVPVLACWAAVALVALAASAWAWRRERSGVALFASVTGVAAVAGFALFLLQLRYPTQPWYYLGLIALLAAAADAALVTSLPSRVARPLRIAITLLVLAAGLPNAWSALRVRQTNVDVVASQLRQETQPGDLILVNPWMLGISLGRYYDGPAEVATVPPMEDLRVHRFDLVKRHMETGAQMGPVISRLRRVLQSGGRVWVVGWLRTPEGPGPLRMPSVPPLPDTGWSMDPYQSAWTLQLGAFMRDHATDAALVPIVAGGPYESLPLVVMAGWH
jgi:hypothetical protein